MGISDVYPTGLRHSANSHNVAVFNDSEYIIYKTQNFKNSAFGQGTDVVWSLTGDYALRDGSKVKVIKQNSNQLIAEILIDF